MVNQKMSNMLSLNLGKVAYFLPKMTILAGLCIVCRLLLRNKRLQGLWNPAYCTLSLTYYRFSERERRHRIDDATA